MERKKRGKKSSWIVGKVLVIVRANKPFKKRASYEKGEVGQGDVDYTRCKAGLPFQQLTKTG